MSIKAPKYCYHSTSGQAYIEVKGRRKYLGVFNSPKSKERYRRIVAEYLSVPVPVVPGEDFTVGKLISHYRVHCEKWYVKNGAPTSEVDNTPH